MQRYQCVLRVSFMADSDVEAELIAMEAQNAVEREVVEVEHGDEVAVSHIGPETAGGTPAELLAACIATRNALIITKSRPCWDVAKEIDKLVFALERGDYSFVTAYDYGRFFDIANKLLEDEIADADAG